MLRIGTDRLNRRRLTAERERMSDEPLTSGPCPRALLAADDYEGVRRAAAESIATVVRRDAP